MNPQQIVEQSQAQKKYPILMKHPAHRKATISGYHKENGKTIDDPPGIPGQFEDHWVSNIDQEQYYASMGYAPVGTGNIEEYRRKLCGFDSGAPSKDYPMALYKLKQDGELDTAVAKDSDVHKTLNKDGWKDSPALAKDSSAKLVSMKLKEPDAGKIPTQGKQKRVMSAETRAKISETQKARRAAKIRGE